MSKYKLVVTKEFEKAYKSYIKKDKQLKEKFDVNILKLLNDPFYKGLRTHKVNTRDHGLKYSSKLTGDLRIIWDFSENSSSVILLTIGGHSGKDKVYK
jgi:mRNA-degrading endonuclease YafQ of YafQ-DinJ toxin-antitoxin module